jgi:hypothetical protein
MKVNRMKVEEVVQLDVGDGFRSFSRKGAKNEHDEGNCHHGDGVGLLKPVERGVIDHEVLRQLLREVVLFLRQILNLLVAPFLR